MMLFRYGEVRQRQLRPSSPDCFNSATALAYAVSLGFRSAEGAWRTIAGYKAMHAIRKGQVRWVSKGDPVGQRQFIHTIFGIAA